MPAAAESTLTFSAVKVSVLLGGAAMLSDEQKLAIYDTIKALRRDYTKVLSRLPGG